MSEIPVVMVTTWQEASEVHLDRPVILVWFYSTTRDLYMRYHGEFYNIDRRSYTNDHHRRQRWSIAGIWFDNDSISWMIDNSIAYPFSPEDLVLYQLTWGDIHE